MRAVSACASASISAWSFFLPPGLARCLQVRQTLADLHQLGAQLLVLAICVDLPPVQLLLPLRNQTLAQRPPASLERVGRIRAALDPRPVRTGARKRLLTDRPHAHGPQQANALKNPRPLP